MCHQCTFCNGTVAAKDIVLVKIDFSDYKPREMAVVSKSYSGIRSICRSCVDGIKGLDVPEWGMA